MGKRVRCKDRALFVYSPSGDVVENAMGDWAENYANRLALDRGKWFPLRLPNYSRELLEATLDMEHEVRVVALYGHGDEANGEVLGRQGQVAIDPENLDRLGGMQVFAMCCHAGKLLQTHGGRARLRGFVGFLDEVHLGFRSSGEGEDDLEVYDGFEEWAADALEVLLATECVKTSEQRLRQGAVDWSFASLATFLKALAQGDVEEAMAAFQSALAFSGNSCITCSS